MKIFQELLAEAEKLKVDKPKDQGKVGPKYKQFPDSKQGIISFLKDPKEVQQSFTKKIDLDTCKIFPDPSVAGVWGVDSMKTGNRIVIYLGGYKDPFGDLRNHNDFETGVIPKRELQKYLDRGDIDQKSFDRFSKEDYYGV